MFFSHRKTVSHLAAFAVLLSFLAGMSSGMSLTAGVGLPAPDLSLETLDGQSVNLSRLKGRNTLILFGATWCPHCRKAFGALENIYESAGDDLIVFFVAVGQSADELNDYFGDAIPPYLILPDENGDLSSLFGIKQIPVCTFIDEAGMIRHKGRFDETIVRRLLSGERLTYPGRPPDGIRAPGCLTQRHDAPPAAIKRYFVELDEEPGLAKRLSKASINAKRSHFRRAAQRIGARVIHNYGKLKNKIVVEISPDKADKLKQLPRFKRFKEDRRVHALLEDSVYQIRADYAWDNAITGQGVKVCVVDTGIDPTHPDLLSKVIAQYDATTGSQNAMDDNGHGTHCAGIIASEGLMYRGVSHDASLLAAKVLDYSGSGYASDVILGINWCVEQEADVISLSLGEGLYAGTCDTDEMAQAVNAAVDAGLVVACAAGNDGDTTRMVSPACASKVIAVGAVDKLDNIASYSDGGDELDLVAPGGEQLGGTDFPDILSTFSSEVANNPMYCLYRITDECWDEYFVVEGTRYIRAVGTSMAAPHVAAAAALLLEENPSLTPSQVKSVLEENADDLGAPGWDNVYGWGRINLEKALDNIPPETGELIVEIAEPNAAETFMVSEQFALSADVDCFGGDGCGDVLAHAEFCSGRNCSDFIDINSLTSISTLDNNPNSIGVLSGYSVDTNAPLAFDAQTMLDISEGTYTKLVNPADSLVGSTLPGEYNTGDLEEQDGVGAIGEDVEVHYEFQIPAGAIKTVSVRMENYIVSHWVYPPFAGWYVYTSNAAGDNLHLVGECIPAEGGGGETPSPDCWFVSSDGDVLADLTAGATNYIKLVSHDVDNDGYGEDFLTFNDIEVSVEYEADPNNDSVYKYYAKFDINDIDPSGELTAARLEFNITQAAEGATAEVYLADNTLLPTDSAQAIHDANAPPYSGLTNPIKSFNCEESGSVSLNVRAAVEEALFAGQSSVAFQISEHNNDRLIAFGANAGDSPPMLTISQKLYTRPGDLPPPDEPGEDPNNGPRTLSYDALIVKDVSEDTYTKYDNPGSAVIGAEFAPEYNTGDLEPQDGIGAIGENAQEHYEFAIPEGIVKTLKVRMENYIVSHWVYPPYAGWYVYTSNADGDNFHLVGDCIPAEGGGGEAPSPDCWFISDDPDVLADLSPGSTSYIKLVSHDVEGDGFGMDFLTFNDIEVIAEYEIDPNNDNVSRYYIKFDISDLTTDAQIDSATLNIDVIEPAADSVARINLVTAYDPSSTAPYTFYDASDADYSSLTNPIKTVACDSIGPKQMNVKAALEDAIESRETEIAFLITEQNEDALFTIDANGDANPPHLDVYTKSDTSAGRAKWTLTPNTYGDFTLRVRAGNDIGLLDLSDARVVTIIDPNLPVVNSVDCMIDSVWRDCRDAQYGNLLRKIRIDASDPQETPNVRLTLTNVPDDHNFVDELLTFSDGFFTHDTNLVISDSGQWRIDVTASDSDGNSDTKTITWHIPWGKLSARIFSPTGDITAPKSSTFDVRAGVECLDAECPDVSFSLRLNDPNELIYDDHTAEDYGDIGSTDGYLAVRFTPSAYPAELRTTRFYVWDQTTYPFELNAWDDDGSDWLGGLGAPGTPLMPPIIVNPVAPSISAPNTEVAWFDIDLSDQHIVINNGSFYIGFRQIEVGKLNQVGFDMSGDSYQPHARSWGMLPGWGWLNLDDMCAFSPDFCGNLMIRAMMLEPGVYSGELPTTVGSAAFYTTDEHPKPCPNTDLDPGQACQVMLTVHAVGRAGEHTQFQAVSANNYTLDTSRSVKVTIAQPLTPCDAANLNAVYPVDYDDIAVLAGQWLGTSPLLTADINEDGETNFKDLARLADFWLNTCQ